MRRVLDRLCYILPSERKFYAENYFPQAVYVGHPLLDAVERYKNEPIPSNDTRPRVALLPGSRKQELRRVLPAMMRLASRHPQYHFTIAGMSLLGDKFYKEFLCGDCSNVDLVYDRTYDLLASVSAAVVCSGTATLETALFRVPQVVCYQCNPVSAAIARRLIASRIKYISLVNLINDEPVVEELIQDGFDVDSLEKAFVKLFDDDARKAMLAGYQRMIDILGGGGASLRTAEEIQKVLSRE